MPVPHVSVVIVPLPLDIAVGRRRGHTVAALSDRLLRCEAKAALEELLTFAELNVIRAALGVPLLPTQYDVDPSEPLWPVPERLRLPRPQNGCGMSSVRLDARPAAATESGVNIIPVLSRGTRSHGHRS